MIEKQLTVPKHQIGYFSEVHSMKQKDPFLIRGGEKRNSVSLENN